MNLGLAIGVRICRTATRDSRREARRVDREVWANAGIELVVESAQRETIGSFPRAFKFDTGDRRTFDGVGRAGRYAAVGIQRNFVRVLAY